MQSGGGRWRLETVTSLQLKPPKGYPDPPVPRPRFPMRRCIQCAEFHPEENFYQTRTKVAGGTKYLSSLCRPCDIKRTTEIRRKLRRAIVAYGGGKCVKCGYSKCVEALEFHHRDPSTKDMAIARIPSLNAKAMAELDKCDLLCANCHREIHAEIDRKSSDNLP